MMMLLMMMMMMMTSSDVRPVPDLTWRDCGQTLVDVAEQKRDSDVSGAQHHVTGHVCGR